MTAYQQLSARRELNVSDITKAVRAGTITAEEAAKLLDLVPLKSAAKAAKAIQKIQVKGQESFVTDDWLTNTPKNSYEGLRSDLSGPEHEDTYNKIMELRGF